MKITDVNQYHVEHSLDGSYEPSWIPGYPQGVHEAEVFEIETDEGITGVTASPSFAGGLDYEEELRLFLLGEDPHDVERVLRKLETVDLLGPRPWHIEVALWDIIGKDAGKPVYKLLGGDHGSRGPSDGIRAYASTAEVQDADERLGYVEDRVDEGFEAVKLRFQSEEIDDDIEVARRVREEFPDLGIMVDANMGWSARIMEDERRWSFGEAVDVARELEKVGVEWLEEPFDRHDYRSYARLREKTDVPLAGGEFNDYHEFREFVSHDSLDVLQPDAMLATGISRAKKVADLAETNGVEFAPHTWTNGIGLAANLHLMAATHARWCEYPYEPPWTPEARDFVIEGTIEHDDGYVSPPEGPGLGVEVDDEVLRE
ncbi:MAG: mandelate racemase/muconate lactonizing enzyme family protein [Halobacteria archaeon]|nr:mandelate racemase/muconate lactonizing enzyme family protein [Halobacteria archaeon]